jgi:hypothetical protein
MSERPPARPKSWRRAERAAPAAAVDTKPAVKDGLPTNAAPGHQGGSFTEADPRVASSRGGFGFRVWS